jgi:hypothetical protein
MAIFIQDRRPVTGWLSARRSILPPRNRASYTDLAVLDWQRNRCRRTGLLARPPHDGPGDPSYIHMPFPLRQRIAPGSWGSTQSFPPAIGEMRNVDIKDHALVVLDAAKRRHADGMQRM